MLPTKKHVLFQEMKNNPVHLITEEDLKQVSILESVNTNKKDKKDERRKKATGNKSIMRETQRRAVCTYMLTVHFQTSVSDRPFLKIIKKGAVLGCLSA